MNIRHNNTEEVSARYPWLWDTEDDNDRFETVLSSAGVSLMPLHCREASLEDYDSASEVKQSLQKMGGIPLADTRRAMARLIDYAPESEIDRLLPLQRFVELWPEISGRIRSKTRKEKMDAFYQRLTWTGEEKG